MKDISKEYIQNIYSRELKFLFDGIANSKNPYHFFTLSTIHNKNPESRTVVLRNVIKKPLTLFFNADYRSPKVKQLINNPNCTALFYDNNRKMQLRFKCKSTIHYNNKISKKVWNKTALQSRKCYMGNYKPSTIIESWSPNIPKKYLKIDPEKKDSELGYKNFTVVELSIIISDILELHHDGHIRFCIDSNEFLFVSP
tara:strand:- start:1206 stop:1799 length:594 start_codon:yes stop_codon:yes gene_type:complete